MTTEMTADREASIVTMLSVDASSNSRGIAH